MSTFIRLGSTHTGRVSTSRNNAAFRRRDESTQEVNSDMQHMVVFNSVNSS